MIRRGYTLVEMAAVLLLLLVMLTVAAVKLYPAGGAPSLEEHAAELREAVTGCRVRAITGGQEQSLSYHPGFRRWQWRGAGGREEELALPAGIEVVIAGKRPDPAAGPVTVFRIDAGGRIDAPPVILEQERRQLKITPSPATGAVRFGEPGEAGSGGRENAVEPLWLEAQ